MIPLRAAVPIPWLLRTTPLTDTQNSLHLKFTTSGGLIGTAAAFTPLHSPDTGTLTSHHSAKLSRTFGFSTICADGAETVSTSITIA